MKYTSFSTVILVALAITSCNLGKTRNVFEGMDPSSKEYKQKLADQIKGRRGTSDLTFTLNRYVNHNGKDYLDINVDGKDIHASSLVLVNNWTKLECIKRTKGIGYSGAELKNLKLAVINSDTNPTFVYKDVEKIVD